MGSIFGTDDIERAIKEVGFSKALGPNLFDGSVLANDDVKANCIQFLHTCLNKGGIKQYLKESRLILLSKTDSNEVTCDNIRPIQVTSHLTKVIEQAIKNKLEEQKCKLF